jgi:uncharacterized protein YkwD
MKAIRTCITILALAAIIFSCKKDDGDFVQVSVFENQLHNELNKYRTSQGLNELVLQYIMVKEAQAHSVGRANGSIQDANVNADMNERWQTVENKLGVNNISNEVHLSVQITTQTAAEVIGFWAADSLGQILLKGDYTQSGPGIGTTSDGRTYVMHMLCKYTNPQ